jgi:hypothetical protein
MKTATVSRGRNSFQARDFDFTEPCGLLDFGLPFDLKACVVKEPRSSKFPQCSQKHRVVRRRESRQQTLFAVELDEPALDCVSQGGMFRVRLLAEVLDPNAPGCSLLSNSSSYRSAGTARP